MPPEATPKWAAALQTLAAFRHCNQDTVRELAEDALAVCEDVTIAKGVSTLTKGIQIPRTFTTMASGLIDITGVDQAVSKRRKTLRQLPPKVQKPPRSLPQVSESQKQVPRPEIGEILRLAASKKNSVPKSISLLARAMKSYKSESDSVSRSGSDLLGFLSKKASLSGMPSVAKAIDSSDYHFSKFDKSEAPFLSAIWYNAVLTVLAKVEFAVECQISENMLRELEGRPMSEISGIVLLMTASEKDCIESIVRESSLNIPKTVSSMLVTDPQRSRLLLQSEIVSIQSHDKPLRILNTLLRGSHEDWLFSRVLFLSEFQWIGEQTLAVLQRYTSTFSALESVRYFNLAVSAPVEQLTDSLRETLIANAEDFVTQRINDMAKNDLIVARSSVESYSVSSAVSKVEADMKAARLSQLRDLDLCLSTAIDFMSVAANKGSTSSVTSLTVPPSLCQTVLAMKRLKTGAASRKVAVNAGFLQELVSTKTPSTHSTPKVLLKASWYWFSHPSHPTDVVAATPVNIDSHSFGFANSRFTLGMYSVFKISLCSPECLILGRQTMVNILKHRPPGEDLPVLLKLQELLQGSPVRMVI